MTPPRPNNALRGDPAQPNTVGRPSPRRRDYICEEALPGGPAVRGRQDMSVTYYVQPCAWGRVLGRRLPCPLSFDGGVVACARML